MDINLNVHVFAKQRVHNRVRYALFPISQRNYIKLNATRPPGGCT